MYTSVTINGKLTTLIPYDGEPCKNEDGLQTAFTTRYAKGAFGDIFFDELITPDYTIHSSNFHTKQPFIMGIPGQIRATELYANLNTGLDYTYDGSIPGISKINRGTFAFRYLAQTGYSMTLQGNEFYELFSVRFSESMLRSFALLAYRIAFLYAKVLQDVPALMSTAKTSLISPPMYSEIAKLLSTPLHVQGQDLLTGEILSALAYNSLLIVFPESILRETIHDKGAQIQEAANLLSRELDTKHNIKVLAHQVGTNDWSLKKKFKSGFGKTIKEYSLQKKMEKAVFLLLTSKMQEKEISYVIGYANLSSMIKAFQNEVGCSPGELRKLSKNLPLS